MKAVTLSRAAVARGDLVLVNRAHPMEEPVEAGALTAVDEAHPDILLCRPAAQALAALLNGLPGGREGICPVSGWRGQTEQQLTYWATLRERGAGFARSYVAWPGCSEHQTGLAIDLGAAGPEVDPISPEFPRDGVCGAFRARMADYGFVERYPEGREGVTGIGWEPWHFRYVGRPHAGEMARRGLTLEEYVEELRRYTPEAPLTAAGADIWFVPAPAEGPFTVELPEEGDVSLSGNNVDGVIVTVRRRHL